MNPRVLVILGAVCAAAGQIFLKLGASGATSVAAYFNTRLAAGFLLYALSSVLWVMALAKLPLSQVYPFTILTFVIVYIASFTMLGDPITPALLVGALLVIVGLIVITIA